MIRGEEIYAGYGLDGNPPVMTDVSTVNECVSPSDEKAPFALPSLDGSYLRDL